MLCVFLYSVTYNRSNFVDNQTYNDDYPELIFTYSVGDGNENPNDAITTYPGFVIRNTANFPMIGTNPDTKKLVYILWQACNNLFVIANEIESNIKCMSKKIKRMDKFQNYTNTLSNPEITFKDYDEEDSSNLKINPNSNSNIKSKHTPGFNWSEVTAIYPPLQNNVDNYALVPILWKATNNLYNKVTNIQNEFIKLDSELPA